MYEILSDFSIHISWNLLRKVGLQRPFSVKRLTDSSYALVTLIVSFWLYFLCSIQSQNLRQNNRNWKNVKNGILHWKPFFDDNIFIYAKYSYGYVPSTVRSKSGMAITESPYTATAVPETNGSSGLTTTAQDNSTSGIAPFPSSNTDFFPVGVYELVASVAILGALLNTVVLFGLLFHKRIYLTGPHRAAYTGPYLHNDSRPQRATTDRGSCRTVFHKRSRNKTVNVFICNQAVLDFCQCVMWAIKHVGSISGVKPHHAKLIMTYV